MHLDCVVTAFGLVWYGPWCLEYMCSNYATVVQFSGIEYWHFNATDAISVFSIIQSPDP
jgi:hypothetical protein